MADFTEPWDLSDVVFSVEDKKIYGSKTILAMWSPVMKAMFFSEFIEKSAAEIALPGKLYDDIMQLFKVLHPPNQYINESNVVVVLPLAREYQMMELTVRCEQYLLQEPASVQSLVLAEEYDLKMLRKKCIKHIRQCQVQDLRRDSSFDLLSSMTRVKILLEKSTRYEMVLNKVTEVINGQAPEQMRFREGGPMCTFSCSDKGNHRTGIVPHNSGTDYSCKTCALKMTTAIMEQIRNFDPE